MEVDYLHTSHSSFFRINILSDLASLSTQVLDKIK